MEKARRCNGKGPQLLRADDRRLWGYPTEELSKVDAEKLCVGNALTRRKPRDITMLEDSAASVSGEAVSGRALPCRFLPIQHAMEKANIFLTFKIHGLKQQLKTCSGRQAFSVPQCPHVILSGTGKDGVFMTLKAQPYQERLCNVIAQLPRTRSGQGRQSIGTFMLCCVFSGCRLVFTPMA